MSFVCNAQKTNLSSAFYCVVTSICLYSLLDIFMSEVLYFLFFLKIECSRYVDLVLTLQIIFIFFGFNLFSYFCSL